MQKGSIRHLFIVAYKTLVVSRDLKLIKDSHPKYVISTDRLYLTELLSLQGVWEKLGKLELDNMKEVLKIIACA